MSNEKSLEITKESLQINVCIKHMTGKKIYAKKEAKEQI